MGCLDESSREYQETGSYAYATKGCPGIRECIYQGAEPAGVGVAASKIRVSKRRVSWRWSRCFKNSCIKAQSQLALGSLLQGVVYQGAESAGLGVAAARISVSRYEASWRRRRCCRVRTRTRGSRRRSTGASVAATT